MEKHTDKDTQKLEERERDKGVTHKANIQKEKNVEREIQRKTEGKEIFMQMVKHKDKEIIKNKQKGRKRYKDNRNNTKRERI